MTELIFSTIHGSRLYGMNHAESDVDMFQVTTSTRTRARHGMNTETGVDTTSVGIQTFLERIYEGSHQSVEALFSPLKQWGEASAPWQSYLETYRVTGANVFAKYERTIKRFCYGDFKRRKHAVRLSFNLADLRAYGRFNPRMSFDQIHLANVLAITKEGDELWKILT